MTTTFRFTKPVDEIEEAVLLPEDWYEMEIIEEPSIEPNSTLREALKKNGLEYNPKIPPTEAMQEAMLRLIQEDEKCGLNLRLILKTESPDDEYNGRRLMLWLPWPSEPDDERYDMRGQKVADAKMSRIVEFVQAFGGTTDGEDITLSKGLKGCCYVTQQKARDSEEILNSIDMFAGFKEYGS